jgi:hypothetical protein
MDGTSETSFGNTSVRCTVHCSEGFNHILNTTLNVLFVYLSLFDTHPAAALNTFLH